MEKQFLHILLSVALASVIPFVLCNSQHTEADMKKYMNELKENIRVYEDLENGFGAKQFTAISIVKKGVTTQETLEMYQSLFEIPDRDDKITVLTIRNNHLPETDSLEKCIEKIATAAQNYIYDKRNETISNGVGITFECIDTGNMLAYDASKRKFGEIEQTKKVLAAFITDKIDEFICIALRARIFNNIQGLLYRGFENCFRGHGKGTFVMSKAFSFADETIECLANGIMNLSISDLYEICNNKPHLNIFQPLELLEVFITRHEEEKGLKYFKGNKDAVVKFYRKIVSKYRYNFAKNIEGILPTLKALFKQEENKKLIRNFLLDVYEKMCDHFAGSRLVGDTYGRSDFYSFYDMSNLSTEDITFFRHYLDKIFLGPEVIANLKESYWARNDEVLKSLRADNLARIVFRGELDAVKLWHLCKILESTKIMKKLHGHQSIYINFESAHNEEELKRSYAKFKILTDKLTDQFAIKVFTTAKSATNDLDVDAKVLLTYSTDSVAVREHEECLLSSKKVKMMCDTTILTETKENLSKISLHANKRHCANINTEHTSQNLIKSNDESIIIDVTHDTIGYLREKKVTITYSMTKSNEALSFGLPKQPFKIAKCLKNVPITIFKDLIRELQHKKIVGTEFFIPNCLSLNHGDCVYTEKIINQSWNELSQYIEEQNEKLLRRDGNNRPSVYFSKTEIIKFNTHIDYDGSIAFPQFAKAFNLDGAKIKKILYEFVINKRIRENATELQRELFLEKAAMDICIFATCDNDNDIFLNICEAIESKSIKSPLVQSNKILTKILANDVFNDFKVVVEKFSNHARVILIISDMMLDIHAKKSFYTYSGDMNDVEKTKYADIFLEWIEDLSRHEKSYNAVDSTTSNAVYQKILGKYADTLKVRGLVDIIISQIKLVLNSTEVKVISLKVGEKKVDPPQSRWKFWGFS